MNIHYKSKLFITNHELFWVFDAIDNANNKTTNNMLTNNR